MIKKLSTILILAFLIISNTIQAQDTNPNAEETTKDIFISAHMAYLMADGGVWIAENPQYKKDEQYSAKTFKYEMSKGVHGENYRIKILADLNDIGWYASWDGYYLWNTSEEKPVYHSLGANGAIANGTMSIIGKEIRINIFEIISYEGKKTTHKDVTRRISENEMESESFLLNEKGEWEFNQKLVWKRKTG